MGQTLYNLRMEYWQQSYKHWATQELFTFPWIFNVVFLLILYIIWVKIVDKHRLRGLILYGSLLSVAAVLIDTIAVTIGLWEYTVSIFPLSPAPFPFDYTVLPIFYMTVLQYTSTWRGYLTGSLVAAALFSFIIEPIYIGLGIKVFHHFNYFFMFVLVLAVTTAIKVIYNWITSIELKNSTNRKNKSIQN
jgi:hypothetical protein